MQAPYADPLLGVLPGTPLLPLIGRESELYLLRALLETVVQDRPTGARALMLSGDVGVGKTRLLAEMHAEAASRGFRLLEGRAYESGGAFPYFPFIEALRPIIRNSPHEALRSFIGLDDRSGDVADGENGETGGISLSQIGQPLVAALARLFPELPGLLRVTIIPEVLSQDQEKFRLFDAIATLLERLSRERPVLLGIDNLQWADSASLELTMYLTVRLHSSRVALVGVTRPPGAPRASALPINADSEQDTTVTGQSSAAALRSLGELMRLGLLMLIPLGPLDRAFG